MEEFRKALLELIEKHKVDVVAELVYSPNGIMPTIKLYERKEKGIEEVKTEVKESLLIK